MKKLYLLRHSKTEPAEGNSGDFDRKLTERGISDAEKMAVYMRDKGYVPDIAIASPAARTRQTLEFLAEKAVFSCLFRLPQKLYLASSGQILAEIVRLEDTFKSVLVVGHNPGLHDTAMRIAENAESPLFDELTTKFPTTSLAVFEFPFDSWKNVEPYSGELVEFTFPKKLGWTVEAD